jgi:hypothetical protein
MTDLKAKLEGQKVAIEKEAKILFEEEKALIDRSKLMQQRLNEISIRRHQLNGSFESICETLGIDPLGEQQKIMKPKKGKDSSDPKKSKK